MPTWIGPHLHEAFEAQGVNLSDLNRPDPDTRIWDHMDRISDERLWEEHIKQKRRLSHFLRGRLREQLARHGEAPGALSELADALDPDVLTIGFARRFATYKRANLIFRDEERLARLIWNEDRPVQFIFAGKAHPADRPGQGVIQHIFGKSREDKFRGRVFILEDYDMRIGRFLVQGCDVWMNNPLRPLEASGTSGMKAAANGVPNCSILDGWWDEGYAEDNGWAVGTRENGEMGDEQDSKDAESLYKVLEEQVVPPFYDRGSDGIPRGWLRLMRRAIATSLWDFSMTRCVQEYADRMYLGAARSKL
jgi:starch phosphorylase